MRKLLLGTTALAAAASLTTNAALADVSISGAYEWSYNARGSTIAALDGTSFGNDSEIKFSFTNKTDSGLTITAVTELEADGDATMSTDEHSISIAGGFGTLKLGRDDSVGDNFGIEVEDLIAEESTPTSNSSGATTSVLTDTDIRAASGDSNKVSYYTPAMGGFSAGMSHTTTTAGTSDSKEYGAQFTTEAGGTTVTIGAATGSTKAATRDIDATNVGVEIVSGNISAIIANATYKANDEDQEANGVSVSYNMGNGMVIGAYTMDSDDALDTTESYSKQGVEVQYTIASGLTAVITMDDYEYKAGDTGFTADNGTNSKLTIKASF
tara:strand:+ start:348 stop:1325 length:978 start_codon:yes stop_codon:yes gene_type:complete